MNQIKLLLIFFSICSEQIAGKVTLESTSSKRLLRGGSYSSGGRSSYSYNRGGGSSYSYNRNRNYNRSSGGGLGRAMAGFAFAVMGFAFLGLLLAGGGAGLSACCAALCCGATGAAIGASAGATGSNYNNQNYYNGPHQPGGGGGYMQNNNFRGSNPQYDFDQSVEQAKREVENSFSTQNQGGGQPFSGQYTTSFVDPGSGTMHNASLCLFFTPDPQRQGFRITGQGSDIDGSTIIEDGFAKYDGTCWWKERAITGDVGLLVLSRGKFNFFQNTFEGTWLANSMISGPYLSFSSISMPNQQTPTPNNTTNIPVVTGTVVDGTPHTNLKNGPVTVVGSLVS